jgi:hypothetical protein
VINREFENWLPGQIAKRVAKENEQERLRLSREQQAMMDKEKKARIELKKFLRTVHGRIQLREMATEKLLKVGRKIPFWGPRPEDMQTVKKSLLAQYCTFARHLERHDFCTVNPPFVQCPDPRCRAVFVTEEQYTSHMKTSAPHNGKAPQYAQFHLMIRNPLGVQLLRNHMMAKHGIGSIVNCIDAWLAIQEWKKVHSREENYHSKGVSIFELYIDQGAPRSVHLESPSIEALRSNLAVVKAREYKGYYQGAFAGPTFFRRVLGLHGQFYEKWTDEQIVPATIFDDVEWECFVNLFQMCDRAYPGSDEHLTYIKAVEAVEEKQRLEKLREYEGIRLRRFYEQAREVKKLDEEIANFAAKVMDAYIDREVEFQCHRITPVAVEEVVVSVLCREQAAHEPLAMIADDAFYWAENNILDEFFDFYVPAFIKSMWEQPELRHGMKQYAGVVRKNIRKKSQTTNIKLDVKNESHEWFQRFMRGAKEDEKATLPLNSETAALRIQRRVRGTLGRNKARKQFTAFYAKRCVLCACIWSLILN